MSIYQNLRKLIAGEVKLKPGHALVHGEDFIDLCVGAWRGTAGVPAVRVYSDDTAEFFQKTSYQGLNVVLGMIGLGAIVNNASVTARLVYWRNGEMFRYTPGLCFNLKNNTAINAPNMDSVVVDEAARKTFMNEVRSHDTPVKTYLRMLTDSPKKAPRAAGTPTPEQFVQAVRAGDIKAIATTPSWRTAAGGAR